MNKEKYVFAQLVSFLNEDKFRRIVNKYQGNRYVKHFTCWNQLLALMFGQLSNRESLRDLIIALGAHRSKCYHLGMGKNVSKSSLARANQDRDYRIFEEFAYYLVNEAQQKRKTDIFKLGGKVYAFDSTTGGQSFGRKKAVLRFTPCTMWKLRFRHSSILQQIHQIEAFFVIKAKKNLQYKAAKWKRRMPKNVLSDMVIELIGFYPKQYYPEKLRLVRYWDEEQKQEFVFLPNAMDISALQVAESYKNRWQVELFFKWFKQHLKIKRFWGTTENTVRIQIYAAICTYCLVAIIQHDMELDRSTYEVLQILSISLTDKTHLKDLFNKTNFQYDKERYDSSEPSLFNF